ncbi:MAG TPA: hypothetical protein VI452_13880 [Marmoricola sp.]
MAQQGRGVVVTGDGAGTGRAVVRELVDAYDAAVPAHESAGLAAPPITWNLTKVPKETMLVPPILQPGRPPRAVGSLVETRPRSMGVGVAGASTILGEPRAPKLLDLYLRRSGVASQPAGPDSRRWGGSVFEPSEATQDVGPHGPFDDRAQDHGPLRWVSMQRPSLLSAAGVGVAAGLALLVGRTR